MKFKPLALEVEKKVAVFRTNNGFSGDEPIPLQSFLLKKNVITVFKPLSAGLSGMAIKCDGMRFMMINQGHTIGKQNFTIGHELYHLFVQENFSSQKCNTGLFESQKDIEEKKADLFSAYLLLPESGVKQLIPDVELTSKNKISLATLFTIAQYYAVSQRAVIYRLFELGLVDRTYFDTHNYNINQTARKFGYDTSLYSPGNQNKMIGDYSKIANELYEKRKISESYYYELMNTINVDPFDKTTCGPIVETEY